MNPTAQINIFTDRATLSYEDRDGDNPHTVATISYGGPLEVMSRVVIFLPLGGRIEGEKP